MASDARNSEVEKPGGWALDVVGTFGIRIFGTLRILPQHHIPPCHLRGLSGRINAATRFDQLAARMPNVKRSLCESASLQPSAVRPVLGRTLWTCDIKPENASYRQCRWLGEFD